MARTTRLTIGDETDPDGFIVLQKQMDGGSGYPCAVWGTFSGATMTVQASPDGGSTWIDLVQPTDLTTAYTFSANGTLWLPSGTYRIKSNGSGDANTSVNFAEVGG